MSAQDSPANFDVPAMRIAFTPIGDANAAHAVFPDGKPGLTRDQALDKAGKHTGSTVDPRQIPGVEHIARYGTFSDRQVTSRHESGAAMHPFANRPAWVVRYFGPGVQIPSDGPTGAAKLYAHAVTIAIDAATGEFMEMYIW